MNSDIKVDTSSKKNKLDQFLKECFANMPPSLVEKLSNKKQKLNSEQKTYTRTHVGTLSEEEYKATVAWETISAEKVLKVKSTLSAMLPDILKVESRLQIVEHSVPHYLVVIDQDVSHFLHISGLSRNVYLFTGLNIRELKNIGDVWFLDDGVVFDHNLDAYGGEEIEVEDGRHDVRCQFENGGIVWDNEKSTVSIVKNFIKTAQYNLPDLKIQDELVETKHWDQLLLDLGINNEDLSELILVLLAHFFIGAKPTLANSLPTLMGNFQPLFEVFQLLHYHPVSKLDEDSKLGDFTHPLPFMVERDLKQKQSALFSLEQVLDKPWDFWIYNEHTELSVAKVSQMLWGESIVIPVRWKPALQMNWKLPGLAILPDTATNIQSYLFGVHIPPSLKAIKYDLQAIKTEFPSILLKSLQTYSKWIQQMKDLPTIPNLAYMNTTPEQHQQFLAVYQAMQESPHEGHQHNLCGCQAYYNMIKQYFAANVNPKEIRKQLLEFLQLSHCTQNVEKLTQKLSRGWKRLLVTKFRNYMKNIETAEDFLIYL